MLSTGLEYHKYSVGCPQPTLSKYEKKLLEAENNAYLLFHNMKYLGQRINSWLILGKSVYLPITMGMSCNSVCVCVCVWVCVTIVSTGQILAKIKNVKNDGYRFWHLQSGCDIASVVLRHHDQLFQGHIFQMLISRQRWELVQNCDITFVNFSICYRMASMWMLYSLTLTYFSRSNFNCQYLKNGEC